MKRTLSFGWTPETALVLAGTGLIASTYGLVRLAYGLLLPDVQADLQMSAATSGYVASGASVAYCVGALCGLLARDHARALVVAALGTAAVGALGTVVAGGVTVFAAATVLASSGAGLASPALVAVVARSVGEPRRARAQATVNSGTGPGLVVVGLLALALLPDWRAVMAVGAVAAAVAGVAVLLLDRRGGARAAAPVDGGPAWVRILAVPALAALLLGTASAVVWTYGRAQVVAGGAGGAASTLAWVALGLGGALTVVTAGRLAAWPATRAWSLTAVVTAVATAAVGAAGGSTVLATLACAVFGWGFVAASSALIVWAGELVPERAAPGTALLFITLVLGQAIGSAVAGAVAEQWSLTAAFLALAVVGLAGASVGACPSPSRPSPPSSRPPAATTSRSSSPTRCSPPSDGASASRSR